MFSFNLCVLTISGYERTVERFARSTAVRGVTVQVRVHFRQRALLLEGVENRDELG